MSGKNGKAVYGGKVIYGYCLKAGDYKHTEEAKCLICKKLDRCMNR